VVKCFTDSATAAGQSKDFTYWVSTTFYFPFQDTHAEDTMVVQFILAARMGHRELETDEEDANAFEVPRDQLSKYIIKNSDFKSELQKKAAAATEVEVKKEEKSGAKAEKTEEKKETNGPEAEKPETDKPEVEKTEKEEETKPEVKPEAAEKKEEPKVEAPVTKSRKSETVAKLVQVLDTIKLFPSSLTVD